MILSTAKSTDGPVGTTLVREGRAWRGTRLAASLVAAASETGSGDVFSKATCPKDSSCQLTCTGHGAIEVRELHLGAISADLCLELAMHPHGSEAVAWRVTYGRHLCTRNALALQ